MIIVSIQGTTWYFPVSGSMSSKVKSVSLSPLVFTKVVPAMPEIKAK